LLWWRGFTRYSRLSIKTSLSSPDQLRRLLVGGQWSLGRAFVDAAIRDRCQKLIGVLFLSQRFAEKFNCFGLAQKFRPRTERSVTRDFIVLGSLRGCQDTCVA